MACRSTSRTPRRPPAQPRRHLDLPPGHRQRSAGPGGTPPTMRAGWRLAFRGVGAIRSAAVEGWFAREAFRPRGAGGAGGLRDALWPLLGCALMVDVGASPGDGGSE